MTLHDYLNNETLLYGNSGDFRFPYKLVKLTYHVETLRDPQDEGSGLATIHRKPSTNAYDAGEARQL